MGKGRAPCCAKVGLNKGSWTQEEDMRLIAYIQKFGHANWRALPKQAGNATLTGAPCPSKWSKIAACLPGRTDNEIKNVWNTHLKKRLGPSAGEQKKGGAKSKTKTTCVDVPAPSPSPSSSTTTRTTKTNCSSGESGEQSNTSKEFELELDKIEIPMLDLGFDFDMLLDAVPEAHCPAISSAPASPCSSAFPPCVVDHVLLDLPELWSIMDAEGGVGTCVETTQAPWNNAAPCHGNVTEASAASADDGKEWWLEDLERELGLWGPIEDNQYQPDPQGLSGHVDPLSTSMDDPVSCYFQAGAAAAAATVPRPEASAVLIDIPMDL